MSQELKKKIFKMLEETTYVQLATVSSQKKPALRSMSILVLDKAFYFPTNKTTRKVQHIKDNPEVAFYADYEAGNMSKTQSIEIEGRASLVSDEKEIQQAMELLRLKMPEMKDMPPDPDMTIVKVKPQKAIFMDNQKSFGHIETVDMT